MVRESAVASVTVYKIDYTAMHFPCYHGSVRRNKGYVGKYRDRCGDLWKDRGVVLMLY